MINRKQIRRFFSIKQEDLADIRLIYVLAKMLFFIYSGIAGIVVLVIIVWNVLPIENGDFQNWFSTLLELGLGLFITLSIVIYENTQNKTRTNKEHQHYKERLTYEFPIFLERMNAMADTIILGQTDSAELNRAHAKENYNSLRAINSIFNIPTEIRSELDVILSDYASVLESVEHGCVRKSDIKKINLEYVKKLKEFFSKKFFIENTNNKINENLMRVNQILDRIINE